MGGFEGSGLRRQFLIALASLLLVMSLGWFAIIVITDPKNTPVRDVKIEGSLQYSNRASIQQRVSDQAVWGFYLLDLVGLRDELLALPWIENASVTRVWPDTLYLKLTEHEPMAIWNDQELVAKDFSIFMPPQLQTDFAERQAWLAHFGQLPRLSGDEGRHAAVVQLYRDLSAPLNTLGEKIVTLIEDERRSISMTLQSGIRVRLGRKAITKRMKRLVRIYAAVIQPELTNVEQVDMRYPQGFAIKFREDAGSGPAGE